MGSQCKASCKECGHRFTLNEGGGLSFEQLHCEKCGCAKTVNLYQSEPGLPSSADDWKKRIEARAGSCRCGGKHRLGARPRCPKCGSLRLDRGEPTLCYD